MDIRAATEADLDAINAIYNQAVRAPLEAFDIVEKTMDERRIWFRLHGPFHPVIVATDSGHVLGWASLSPWAPHGAYSRTVEDSIFVASGARGRGVGKRLLSALLEKAEELGHHVVIARITDGNSASLALHEQHGFENVGVMREVGFKNGVWLDEYVLQRRFTAVIPDSR